MRYGIMGPRGRHYGLEHGLHRRDGAERRHTRDSSEPPSQRLPAPVGSQYLRLFGSRSFSGANLLTLLLYGALSAATFFLSLDLVQAQGYSKTQAGSRDLGATLPPPGLAESAKAAVQAAIASPSPRLSVSSWSPAPLSRSAPP